MEGTPEVTSERIQDTLLIGEGAVLDEEAIKNGTMGYMREDAMTGAQGMGPEAAAVALSGGPAMAAIMPLEQSPPAPSDAPTLTSDSDSKAQPTGTHDGSAILGEGPFIDAEALKNGAAPTSREAMLKLAEEPSEERKQELEALMSNTGKPKDDPTIIPDPPAPEPAKSDETETRSSGPSKDGESSKSGRGEGKDVTDLLDAGNEPESDGEMDAADARDDMTAELGKNPGSQVDGAKAKMNKSTAKTEMKLVDDTSSGTGPKGMPLELKRQLLSDSDVPSVSGKEESLMSEDINGSSDRTGSSAVELGKQHKPTLMEKLKGEVKVLQGKLSRNEKKVEEGKRVAKGT